MQVVKFPSRPTQWAHLIWVSTGGIVQSLVDSWDDGPCMMECRGYPNSCTKNAFQWTRKHIPPVKKENHRLKSTFWRGYVNFLEGMYFTYWTSSGVFLHTGVQMCFYILNVVCLQNGLTSVVNQIFIGVVSVCSIWFSKKNTRFKHVVLWLVNFELWTMYYHQYLLHQPPHSWVHHFQPLFSSSSCRVAQGCEWEEMMENIVDSSMVRSKPTQPSSTSRASAWSRLLINKSSKDSSGLLVALTANQPVDHPSAI